MSTSDAAAPPPGWPVYDISFADAVRRGFTQCVTFTGRAGRAEFWYWYLFVCGVLLIIGVPTVALGAATATPQGEPGPVFVVGAVLGALFYLAAILPTVAVACRRLHDAGFSGLFLLLGLVTGLIPLIMCVLPTSPAAVRYGPPGPPGPYGLAPGFLPPQGHGSQPDQGSQQAPYGYGQQPGEPRRD